MKTQHHQIWIIHVINNTQEHNLIFSISSPAIILKACLSSPAACVFTPTACISTQQEAEESRRSSLTLWSTDHALFWFPFDLTIWVHCFPPPEAHLACWHELRIGIAALSFSADGRRSRPNAAEVVILNNSFWFMTTFPTESSDLPDCVEWTVLCRSVNSPDTHSRNWQRNVLN